MRFRKSIRLGKGIRLNLSKSGASVTLGGKGASVNIGNKGAYLNAGIPGTGLSERIKLGVGGDKKMTKVPNKTLNTILTVVEVIAWIVGGVVLLYHLYKLEKSIGNGFPFGWVWLGWTLVFPIYWIIRHIRHKRLIERAQEEYQKARWEELDRQMAAEREEHHRILTAKLEKIKSNEHFSNCKICNIDLDNIIAFSDQGFIAIYTKATGDDMKVIEVDHITKITQELKSGPCYAHFFTDIFETPDIDLYLGYCSGKEDMEKFRDQYNEIKNMYTILKKKGKTKEA